MTFRQSVTEKIGSVCTWQLYINLQEIFIALSRICYTFTKSTYHRTVRVISANGYANLTGKRRKLQVDVFNAPPCALTLQPLRLTGYNGCCDWTAEARITFYKWRYYALHKLFERLFSEFAGRLKSRNTGKISSQNFFSASLWVVHIRYLFQYKLTRNS